MPVIFRGFSDSGMHFQKPASAMALSPCLFSLHPALPLFLVLFLFFRIASPCRGTLFSPSPGSPSAGSLWAAHTCALVIACESSPLPPPLHHPVSASRHICTSGKTGLGAGSSLQLPCSLPSVPASFWPDTALHMAWTPPIVP